MAFAQVSAVTTDDGPAQSSAGSDSGLMVGRADDVLEWLGDDTTADGTGPLEDFLGDASD